tara:strand:+ start:300 stop:440 length:141 start_codon:yes stop_codon:yes gene_type:complete
VSEIFNKDSDIGLIAQENKLSLQNLYLRISFKNFILDIGATIDAIF